MLVDIRVLQDTDQWWLGMHRTHLLPTNMQLSGSCRLFCRLFVNGQNVVAHAWQYITQDTHEPRWTSMQSYSTWFTTPTKKFGPTEFTSFVAGL